MKKLSTIPTIHQGCCSIIHLFPALLLFLFLLPMLLLVAGCGKENPATAADSEYLDSNSTESSIYAAGLTFTESEHLDYAVNFSIYKHPDGYRLLETKDGTRLLVIPDGKPAPTKNTEGLILVNQPVKQLYLVASSVMDMFSGLNALDSIRLSGQKAEGWYIEAAKHAMEEGKILYAGKYSRPDYELILSEQCTLAIENSMLLHSPEVKEKLEALGISVLIEYSSMETHPLARVEWIKFFGALLGKESEAKAIFDKQKAQVEDLQLQNASGSSKTVAFFSIASNGTVRVRRSTDYVPKMIQMAGGKYFLDTDPDDGNTRSTYSIQTEDFFEKVKDVDYLIYNSAIGGGVQTKEELLDRCPILKNTNAVEKGNLWCTTNDMYQQSLAVGAMTEDIHKMLQGEEQGMTYLFKLKA